MDAKQSNEERAKRLRKKIDQLANRLKEPDSRDSQPSKEAEKPRDFVDRRMHELDQDQRHS